MRMPTIRRAWSLYKRTVLQEGLGLTRRDHVQVVVQHAFYCGAHSMLQGLATLLQHGDVEEAHRFIAREGRRVRALRGMSPRTVRH